MHSTWTKCTFVISADFAETFAWLLAQALDHPIETRDETTMSKWLDTDKLRVVASFDGTPPDTLESEVNQICEQLNLDRISIHTESIADNSWKEGWKTYFEPQLIDERLCIHPPWRTAPDAEYTIEIEPGMAFGTGTHETTKMMLSMMLRHLSSAPSTHVFDVGSGSGILSIAAEQFGHEIFGVEIDPVAVENANANLDRNQCKAITFRAGTIQPTDAPRPWVLVNILAKIIMEIREDIDRIAQDHLLLSGFLMSQREELLQGFSAFTVIDEMQLGEWGCVYLRRMP